MRNGAQLVVAWPKMRTAPSRARVSPIRLREGASIGAGAVVVAGHDVGCFATVGAGAVVTHDVPDYGLVAGNPARLLGWVCECGRRLVDRDGVPLPPDALAVVACAWCDACYVIGHDSCIREPTEVPA